MTQLFICKKKAARKITTEIILTTTRMSRDTRKKTTQIIRHIEWQNAREKKMVCVRFYMCVM